MPAEMSEEERFRRVRAAIAAMRGIKPQDEIEGMLATQMVATHAAAMECLRRAMLQARITRQLRRAAGTNHPDSSGPRQVLRYEAGAKPRST